MIVGNFQEQTNCLPCSKEYKLSFGGTACTVLLLNLMNNGQVMLPKQLVVIKGYCTRKDLAQILGITARMLYNLLTSEVFKDVIPKRGRISPAHQQLIFEHVGIPYVFDYKE